MEKDERKLNISFGKAGNGGRTAKLSIPIKWLDEMQISLDEREINIKFKENKILIEKRRKNG